MTYKLFVYREIEFFLCRIKIAFNNAQCRWWCQRSRFLAIRQNVRQPWSIIKIQFRTPSSSRNVQPDHGKNYRKKPHFSNWNGNWFDVAPLAGRGCMPQLCVLQFHIFPTYFAQMMIGEQSRDDLYVRADVKMCAARVNRSLKTNSLKSNKNETTNRDVNCQRWAAVVAVAFFIH